ncbi:arylsulfatase [Streptomyces aureoverticillatus]|uniref:arylsulfatase n=1 Tax=Streptomyces aureoverticillatus TaxID=66871 RepID=UPI0013DBB686|nr:arylsulfatase [Streptomyces aureoverticillatus]QIB46533.1 arylsulfatase [Streptomyces aureoverticillatus]
MTRNVVLITADQWRGDCLSAAGHPVVRTPYLDQLAGRGARFEKAYSAVPSCIPARAALHTGLAQTSHRRTGYRDGVPWEYPVTLASEFGRHGYQTRAIGKLHAFPERNRIGFDEVTLHDGYLHASRVRGVDPRFHDDYLSWLEAQPGERAGADYADTGLDCNSVVARPWPRAERLHPTNWVVSEAVDFLYRRDVTAPFLLHLSFHRPHPPYDPPAWAFEQFLRAPFEEPVVGDWADALAHWRDDSRADANYATYDAETVHRARAGYYGHMAHIDQQINRFLTALSEFGLADDTWVCFTSDHGEMLGEHRLWRKAYPYEGSARVPLLLAGPSGSLPRGGVVSSALAELRDVMPTLLECAGLPVPGGLDGHSLLPAARGSSLPAPRAWLHGEHALFGESMQWLTDGREKYVWFSGTGREQLFDLVEDPREACDLAPSAPRAVAVWRERLVGELAGRPEGYVADGALVPGRAPLDVLPEAPQPRPFP